MTATALTPVEALDRVTLEARQAARLAEVLDYNYGRNEFLTAKLDSAGVSLRDRGLMDDFPNALRRLPFTTKDELVENQQQHAPWGTFLTEPITAYSRYCQTSSTTGVPLRWCDTNDTWQWMLDCWRTVFRAAHVTAEDRIFIPFSFGPFLGFWTAFEAGCQMGAHCIPGGGMSSQVRLRLIEKLEPTVICSTPTYALWLAEIAASHGDFRPLDESSVHTLIVAGEPGGSIPATRSRIESSWGARVLDHHGLTETGPISFECRESPGTLHINEAEYIAEVVDPETGEPVDDGTRGELIITNLGRIHSPVIRYRSRDIVVRNTAPCVCGRTFAHIEGGILARADDMINIRGVNVYPAAIEAVVRRFDEIVEFRSTASRSGSMWSLSLEVEAAPGTSDVATIPSRLSNQLREALGLTVPVYLVEPDRLPRFEMKARRFVIKE